MPLGLLARHPGLARQAQTAAATHWPAWQRDDPRLDSFADLDEVAALWHAERAQPCYLAIAALAGLGSRRGGDDDDAALAVLVILHEDIDLLTGQLRRICQPDDVLWAVWDSVKRAEPQLECRAPYFLLHRAKDRLLAAHRASQLERPAGHVETLDHLAAQASPVQGFIGTQPVPQPGEPPPAARVCTQDAATELERLLGWAAATGRIATSEVDLLGELVSGPPRVRREEAMRLIGERHGVGLRTIRRRRDAAVQALRCALPDYLAAVS